MWQRNECHWPIWESLPVGILLLTVWRRNECHWPIRESPSRHHAAYYVMMQRVSLANSGIPASGRHALLQFCCLYVLTSVASKAFKMGVCSHYLRLLLMAVVLLDVAILGERIDRKFTTHKFSTQHRWKRSAESGIYCASTKFGMINIIHCCR